MAFPSIGLSAVFDVKDFMRNAEAYDKKVSEITGKTSTAATDGTKAMASLGKGIATGMAAGAAALVGVGVAVGKLVSVTKDIPAVSAAFEGLGGSIETMRQGSLGMVTDIDLMKSYNSAAQLVSKEFAEDLGPAMQYLSKVSAATGQDMGFMIDSLVKGVGRLSPMILDNLGIQVNATEANDAYAKSLGISAEELTKSQQQTAMMNLVMEKLKANTADMPPVIGTSAQAMASFQTTLMNVRNELGTSLIPIIAELQTALLPIAQSLMTAFANPAFKQGVADAAKFIGDLVVSLLAIDPVAVKVGVTIVTLGLALPKLATAFTTVKTAVMALNLVIAANPIGAIAIAIVAAGLGIAAVIQKIKTSQAELATETANTDAVLTQSSETYAQYTQRMVDMLREQRNLPPAMTDSVIAMHALEDGLIRTEANFNAMRVSAAEVGPALQGIGIGAEDMRTSMSVAQRVMEDSVSAMQEMPPAFHDIESAAAGTAKAVGHWRDVADEGFTDINDLMVEAFSNSAEFKGHLDSLSKLYAQHMQKMQDITEDGIQAQEELQFQHQLDMVQAEGEYHLQREALVAAGNTKAVEQLDAKFTEETARSEVAYGQQQLLQERALIQQRITEQQSYIAALTIQQDAMVAKLHAMVLEAAAADGIITAREQGLLDTILLGASEQLKAEVKKGEKLAEIEKLTSEGSIKTAEERTETLIAISGGEIGAAKQGLADLQKINKETNDKILAATKNSLQGLGATLGGNFSAGISAGAKAGSSQAKKDATAVVADVTADVAKAVEAAKKTMVSLEELVFTPEMMAGWDQMGEMLKAGAKKMFEWLQAPDMKKMLKEVAEFQESIMAVFGMAGAADVGGLSPKRYDFVDQATAWANDVALWSEQMIDLGRTMVDSLLTIKGLWSGTEIEDAANLTPQVSLIFEMLGSAADAMATFAELVLLDTDKAEEQLVIFGKLVTSIISTLMDVSKTLDADAVDASARILDSSVSVVEFVTPASEAIASLSEFIASDATHALDNLEGWSSTITDIVLALVDVAKDLHGQGIEASAKIFSSAEDIVSFITPAVEAIASLAEYQAAGDMSAVGESLTQTILTLIEGMESARMAIGIDLEDEAVAFYGDVQDVLGVLKPALEVLAELVNWPDLLAALNIRPSRNPAVVSGLKSTGKQIAEIVITLIQGMEMARTDVRLALDLTPAALKLWEDVQEVIGVLGPALEAMRLLAEWPYIFEELAIRPSRNPAVVSGLKSVGNQIGELILTLIQGLEYAQSIVQLQLTQAAVDFWGAVQSVTGVFGSAIDAMRALVEMPDLKDLPVKTALFETALGVVLTSLQTIAEEWRGQGIEAAVAFWTAMETAMGSVSAGIGAMTDLEQYQGYDVSRALTRLSWNLVTVREWVAKEATDMQPVVIKANDLRRAADTIKETIESTLDLLLGIGPENPITPAGGLAATLRVALQAGLEAVAEGLSNIRALFERDSVQVGQAAWNYGYTIGWQWAAGFRRALEDAQVTVSPVAASSESTGSAAATPGGPIVNVNMGGQTINSPMDAEIMAQTVKRVVVNALRTGT